MALVRGQGSRVWDADGKEYLDLICGIAVNALGHCHPAAGPRRSRSRRATLWHVSNLFFNPRPWSWPRRWPRPSFARRVFFCNSGPRPTRRCSSSPASSTPTAGHPERNEIVACVNSFHGRTLFALTVTGQEKYHHGFEPLVPGRPPRPLRRPGGAGAGARPRDRRLHRRAHPGRGRRAAAPGRLPGRPRGAATRAGALFCLDEVQTGMGRTGAALGPRVGGRDARHHELGQGARQRLPHGRHAGHRGGGEHLTPGSHASTFGGNALASAVALATPAGDPRGAPGGREGRRAAVRAARRARLRGGRVVGVRGRGMLARRGGRAA